MGGLSPPGAALRRRRGTTWPSTCRSTPPADARRRGVRREGAAAVAASPVDFALWGGLVPGQPSTPSTSSPRAASSASRRSCRTAASTEFPAADDLTLCAGMARAARLGPARRSPRRERRADRRAGRRAVAEGRSAMRDYVASRPVVAETEAIGRALALAAETGCALHVVHVSSGAGVALVAEARARGVDVSCETCPHYLVLDEDDAERIGAVAKCAPPLRPRAELEALWEALEDGTRADGRLRPLAVAARAQAGRRVRGLGRHRRAARRCSRCSTGSGRLDAEALADCTSGFPARRFRLEREGPAGDRAPTPTSWPSTRPPAGRSRRATCSAATTSARSWGASCTRASCTRSCAAAPSTPTGVCAPPPAAGSSAPARRSPALANSRPAAVV